MRRFRCPACGAEIWFHNSGCLSCGAGLAFVPGQGFATLAGAEADPAAPAPPPTCGNREIIGCNWAAEPGQALCRSCLHTTVIPDLSVAGNTERWASIERAKRALMRSLDALGLPLADAAGAPLPVFVFMGDIIAPDGTGAGEHVMTGHQQGTITLNIAEADDDERERIRIAMGEPYRTLIGHLRHEVAHHYWDVLVRDRDDWLARFREVFGDEREDYGAALARHYGDGPAPDWPARHVSSYAAAHPWEDFAESWAHLLHILDGLETAIAYGMTEDPALPRGGIRELCQLPMTQLADEWIALSIALNAVNEAMGHGSFYPFVLNPAVIDKLEVIRAGLAEIGAAAPAQVQPQGQLQEQPQEQPEGA